MQDTTPEAITKSNKIISQLIIFDLFFCIEGILEKSHQADYIKFEFGLGI